MIPRKHSTRGLIPMTSMADIAFILLIFFILTSTIDIDKNIQVSLPNAERSSGGTYKFFHVWIDRYGGLYLRGEKRSEDDIFEFARYRSLDNPDVKGIIAADGDVPFETVNRVMELLRDSGVYNIVLLTKKKSG